MKNNAIIVLLVILIGVLSGFGLLFGIGNAVQVATIPLVERVDQILANQKTIERKINEMDARLTALDGKLADLGNQVKSGARPSGPIPTPGFQQPPAEDLQKIYDLPVGNSPIIGDPNAKVTITEFSDFQCPFCARFYPAVKETMQAYPKGVRLIIKNFPLPFHPNARPAAKVAMAANEQGKFQGMMELLLQNGGDYSDDKLKEYCKTLGINYDKLKADLKNKDAQYEQQITTDLSLGDKADVRGTPTFYINGRKTMARDVNGFKAEIDKILAK